MYSTSDNGDTWILKNNGMEDIGINSLFNKSSTIYAGTSDGVFASTNNGGNWSNKNFNEEIVTVFANSNNIFISGEGFHAGIYVSTNNGSSWTSKNSGLNTALDQHYRFVATGDSVFAGGTQTGVYLSTDGGENWTPSNEGLSEYVQKNELMFASNNSYIFVGSKGNLGSGFCNLWRLPLLPVDTTGIDDFNAVTEMIRVFPNPANDIINLTINLPSVEVISFSISDILGNSKIIFNSELNPGGNNNISIPVDNYPAGTYYITLITSGGTISKAISIY